MTDGEAGKSKKRKFPSLAVLIPTVLVLLFFAWVVYFIIDFGNGMFNPQEITGNEARSRIEGFFGTPLPGSAGNFYYREEGFQDSFLNVGMDLPREDAWKFIEMYSGKKKKDFSALNGNDSFSLNIPGFWSTSEMKSPLMFSKTTGETSRCIIYDEETGRLLVSLSSW